MTTPRVQLLTVPEVCAALRVCRDTVYQLIRRGRLKPVKVGRRTLFRETDLQRFIDRNGGVA